MKKRNEIRMCFASARMVGDLLVGALASSATFSWLP
jgi:hypothetical protein